MNYLFWIFISVLTLIIEFISFSLVSIWFSISAIILAVLSLYITNINNQFFIFSILSLIFLLIFRKIIYKYLYTTKFESNFVGTKVKIIKKEEEYYLVKFKGVIYKAISNEKIEVGEYRKIKEFSGNKIILEE